MKGGWWPMVEDTLSRFRVLPLTSPVGFAPRPVWGPRCRRLGAQVNVTQKRDKVITAQIAKTHLPVGEWKTSKLGRSIWTPRFSGHVRKAPEASLPFRGSNERA